MFTTGPIYFCDSAVAIFSTSQCREAFDRHLPPPELVCRIKAQLQVRHFRHRVTKHRIDVRYCLKVASNFSDSVLRILASKRSAFSAVSVSLGCCNVRR